MDANDLQWMCSISTPIVNGADTWLVLELQPDNMKESLRYTQIQSILMNESFQKEKIDRLAWVDYWMKMMGIDCSCYMSLFIYVVTLVYVMRSHPNSET